jgi:hypothetical protein
MGFLSSPQSILLSTTGGATGLGSTGQRIEQRFGYQTLVYSGTAASATWTTVAKPSFESPSASYTVKEVATRSIEGTPAVFASALVSTPHTQVAADITTSSVSVFSALHVSSITINAYADYISTFALRNSAVIGGRLKIYGSTATVGSLLAVSSINTGGDFFAGGANISSRQGVIGIQGDIVTMSSVRAQRTPSTGILYTRFITTSPTSTSLFRGPFVGRAGADIAGALTMTGSNITASTAQFTTSTLLFHSTTQFGLTAPLKYIQLAPSTFNFLNAPIETSSVTSADVACANWFFTSNLVADQLTIVSTISTILFISAVISNPAGSASFSSVTIDDARVRDRVEVPVAEVGGLASANTLSLPAAAWSIEDLGSRAAGALPQYSLSTLTTTATGNAQTVAAAVDLGPTNIATSTVASTLTLGPLVSFAPAATIHLSNVAFTCSSITTDHLYASTTLSADGFSFNSFQVVGGAGAAIFRTSTLVGTGALQISTLSSLGPLITSSITAARATFGAPLLYSTINPSTPYFITSTYLLNDPPFSMTTGLGTYFSPIEYTSIKTSEAIYAIIDPIRNTPVTLSTPFIVTAAGTGTPGNGGDGSFGRIAPIGQTLGRVAIDAASNIYIGSLADRYWTLRRIDGTTGYISTVGGRDRYYYGDGGPATAAAFGSNLTAMALGPGGPLVVQDADNQRLRLYDPVTSTVSLLAGTGAAGPAVDGVSTLDATFQGPRAATWQPSTGLLYIADSGNHCIRRIDTAASTITTFAGTAGVPGYSGDGGPAAAATLRFPYGVLFDASENLLISDTSNNVIRRVDMATNIITTFAGTGTAGYSGDGGPATAATFRRPQGLAMDNFGFIYVADTSNNVVRKILVDTGDIVTAAGNGTPGWSGDNGLATAAQLRDPVGLGINHLNNELYIADSGNHCIRRVDAIAGFILTLAGAPEEPGFSGDGGPPAAAQLFDPVQVVFEQPAAAQRYYIVDQGNSRVRYVDISNNRITTVIGNGTPFLPGDGGPAAAAMFQSITAVAVHPTAALPDIYVVDSLDQKVRKIAAATGIITTVAGNGEGTYNGDGIPATAAALNFPTVAAVAATSNLFIADTANQRVRRVDAATGIITTVAGDGRQDFTGDGVPATTTALNNPQGIVLDSAANLFIADTSNYRIRRVDAGTGIISTVVGAGYRDPVVSGAAPRDTPLQTTTDIALAGTSGTQLFFTELETNRIWQVSTTGLIAPLTAGSTSGAFFGDSGPAAAALLNAPLGLAADPSRNLLISDSSNYRIRRTYTFGAAQFSRYVNMDFKYTNYSTLTGAATISINGNPVKTFTAAATSTVSTAIFTLTDADILAYQQNVFNPITLDQTPFITVQQTDTVGYTRLQGRLWVNQVPAQQSIRNLVDSTAGIEMNFGSIQFPAAVNAITIQNPYNDATARNLFYTGGLYFASDPAVKEDIVPASVNRCTDILEALPLKRYSYVSSYRQIHQPRDGTRLGFLTTDVAPHFPKSVCRAEDFGHETLDLAQIRAAHLGATQALEGLIDELEKEVAELQARLTAECLS